jgi:hydrogenase nickel incorporation protein HypA/HybF
VHELAITEQIVEALIDRCGRGERVTRVVLEIGKLAAVLPDALRFCFDACAEGTPLEGASLEIVETPGVARCEDCGGRVLLERPFGRCACGSSRLEWLSGEELRIREMEVI